VDLPFFPDFFVVGAPRCGTSALSRYLKKHRQICFSKPKEPHYFTRVPAIITARDVQRDYLDRFFPHYHTGHKSLGEGSVSYLYCRETIELILRFNPQARLIVNVRNPLEMLRSYHGRLLYVLEEEVTDFAKAWELQAARARGERIPKFTREPRLLQYKQVAMLGEHVDRLLRQAGRDRTLVVVLDDLVSETERVYCQVLQFLGLESDGRKEFPQKRASRGYRFRLLQRLLCNPPEQAKGLITAYERSRIREKNRKSWLRRMRKRLLAWNTVKIHNSPLDEAITAELRETYGEDVARLGDLLGRDLSHWLQSTC
jgi:hypothetical protein